jgi:hypothetical protein
MSGNLRKPSSRFLSKPPPASCVVAPAHMGRHPGHTLLLMGLLAVLGFAFVLLVAEEAEASHFRGGTPTSGTDVVVEGWQAWRADSRFASASACSVGAVVASESSIQFGDGAQASFSLKTTACNVAQNWMVGEIVDASGNPITKTYTSPGTYTLSWGTCCRIGYGTFASQYHVNNPDGSQRTESTVDLAGTPNQPPKPFVPPIVACPTSGSCTIPIAYSDSDAGQVHTVRWSTTMEAAGGASFYQPGPCPAQGGSPGCGSVAGATLSSSGGTLTMQWDTTGATLAANCASLYSAQVMIEDGRSNVPMDFMIRLCDLQPPQWVTPPTPCGQTITASPGSTVTFSLQAMSPDSGRTVQILTLQKPAGSTVSIGSPGNPTSASFSWNTAGVAEGDYLVVHYAQDDMGATAPACNVNIHLEAPRPVLVNHGVHSADGAYLGATPWGGWMALPGATNVASNYLRISNTGNAPGTVSINFIDAAFAGPGGGSVPITDNLRYCHATDPAANPSFLTFSCDTPPTGSRAITINVPAGHQLWAYYELMVIPDPTPDGAYQANYSVA